MTPDTALYLSIALVAGVAAAGLALSGFGILVQGCIRSRRWERHVEAQRRLGKLPDPKVYIDIFRD